MKDDRLYLIHIGECIERIERYVASGHAIFQENTLIQDAVLRNLHTLTESTQRISDSLKAAHPEVGRSQSASFGEDIAVLWRRHRTLTPGPGIVIPEERI